MNEAVQWTNLDPEEAGEGDQGRQELICMGYGLIRVKR
jgi:hypothetical protein